ncbi:hypothetical protein V491_08718 [Pseudogymnoascus sp. VKM F-3775]|nr:hypothetical protein V491_08718 [Pseudogymnoascus sp. VKM F-3775]
MAPPGRTSPPPTESNSDTTAAPAISASTSNIIATSQDAPPSPRPGSGAAATSLQATAAVNAGLAQEDSRRTIPPLSQLLFPSSDLQNYK